jgi:hypothetical protein
MVGCLFELAPQKTEGLFCQSQPVRNSVWSPGGILTALGQFFSMRFFGGVNVHVALTLGKYGVINGSADAERELQLAVF